MRFYVSYVCVDVGNQHTLTDDLNSYLSYNMINDMKPKH